SASTLSLSGPRAVRTRTARPRPSRRTVRRICRPSRSGSMRSRMRRSGRSSRTAARPARPSSATSTRKPSASRLARRATPSSLSSMTRTRAAVTWTPPSRCGQARCRASTSGPARDTAPFRPSLAGSRRHVHRLQHDDEARAAALAILDAAAAGVAPGQLMDDGQTEAGAGGCAGAVARQTPEGREDALALAARHARAAILDGELDAGGLAAEPHRDVALGRPVLDRVVEKVEEEAREAVLVDGGADLG